MPTNTFVQLTNGTFVPSIGFSVPQTKNDAEIEILLNKAFDAGIRHFATSFVDQNEAGIGKTFQKWFSSGLVKREELFITSQLPSIGMWSYRVNEFLKLSLKDLGIDYVDLYMVEAPFGFQYIDSSIVRPINEDTGEILLDSSTHLESIWRAMEYEVRIGRAKNIAALNFNQKQMKRILAISKIHPQFQQVDSELDQINANLQIFNIDNIKTTKSLTSLSKKYEKDISQIYLRFFTQIGNAVICESSKILPLDFLNQIYNFQLDKDELKLLNDEQHLNNYKENLCGTWFKKFPGVCAHPEFPWPINHN